MEHPPAPVKKYPSSAKKMLSQTEFIRNCFVLVPPAGKESHTTVYVEGARAQEQPRIFCTCSKGSYAECEHAALLSHGWAAMKHECGELPPQAAFEQSRFAHLLMPLVKSYPWVIDNCRVETVSARRPAVQIVRNEKVLITCQSPSTQLDRFRSRMDIHDEKSRAALLRKAEGFMLSDTERAMADAGHWTTRRGEQNSVWFRFMYHLWREYGDGSDIIAGGTIEERSGDFQIYLRRRDETEWFARLTVPRDYTEGMLKCLSADMRNENRFSLAEQECEICFDIACSQNDQTIRFAPFVQECTGGATLARTYIDKSVLFGNLILLSGGRRFCRLSDASRGIIAHHWDAAREVARQDVADCIEKNLSLFSFEPQQEAIALDLFSSGGDDLGRLDGVRLVSAFDRVELAPTFIGVESCELSAHYISGDVSIPVGDILDARGSGRRFMLCDGCIIDLKALPLTRLGKSVRAAGKNKGISLARAALLQLRAGGAVRLSLDDSLAGAKTLRNMMELKPALPLENLHSLKTVLRPYQKNGVSWLLFLWDNAFGGLLCDDMGLGKTHQTLGLIAAMREQRNETGCVLIVCPTTVLPHWLQIARDFAPEMNAVAMHGPERNWQAAEADIILTTYGTLRADFEQIGNMRLALAVFDEAQNIKNPCAQVSMAAKAIDAKVKLCLTGTPIENSTADLKSLVDLVMPGYLGDDDDFLRDYLAPIEEGNDEKARAKLKRLTEPFILRRLKSSVLADLPPKIEDIYTCELSAEQYALYRELVDARGGPLLAALRNDGAPIPYIDILSLLTQLKQLCDHPAVLAKKPADYARYRSAKWDLFCELLNEILGSGQKVVVYSQYLDMIKIICSYLENHAIGHAVLTGASRKRGDIVKRFAVDEACRVFVGSLKAGATGIDLTAATAVIHYDRWWNAAREDQATDRVHRIGQTRGVQVMKLVTLHTLEEKIDALIASRRELMNSVLAQDSPDAMKSFSRQELIEILQYQ